MSYRGRIPNDVQGIVEELRQALGDITTQAQVAKASKFQAGLRLTTDGDKSKRRAWEMYMQKSANVDGARAWQEVMLYRAIAHSSVFFVPEQVRSAREYFNILTHQ
jgi:hypothetical protein